MRLLPHDASFFAHFEHQGKKTVEGCRAFLRHGRTPDRPRIARRAGQADRARVRRDHARGGRGAAQDVHHADRPQRHLRADHEDGRHHGLRGGGRRSRGAVRDPDDDQGGRRPGPLPGAQRRTRAGRGVEHPRPRKPNGILRALHRDQPAGERGRQHPAQRAGAPLQARRRTRSRSSSGKRSTRRSNRRPTAARTSPTSSRASSSRTARQRRHGDSRRDRRDRAGLRLHQRLPRRRELDRDRRVDARADAASGR